MVANKTTCAPPRRRYLALEPPEIDGITDLLASLSEPNRLRIFALLTRAELCVCEITEALGLKQSLVSNHLRVLRRLGLVKARRDDMDNRWVYYSLNQPTVERLRSEFTALTDLSHMDTEPADCVGGRVRP